MKSHCRGAKIKNNPRSLTKGHKTCRDSKRQRYLPLHQHSYIMVKKLKKAYINCGRTCSSVDDRRSFDAVVSNSHMPEFENWRSLLRMLLHNVMIYVSTEFEKLPAHALFLLSSAQQPLGFWRGKLLW